MSAGPVLDPAGVPLDRIELRGLTARGHHGVFADERRDGQDFTVDAVLHLDTRAAAASDDLADTVDYGVLAVAVADVIRGAPVDLIERLAQLVADACLADERVQAVDVVVHKPSAPIPETFQDVVVAVRRRRPPVRAVLALGANLGDRYATLRSAVQALAGTPGVDVLAVSDIVETDPVGLTDQPAFLNAVALVSTTLPPAALLAACQLVEDRHGRVRTIRWGPRTLDVDIVSYGDLVRATAQLQLPHPRAAQRAFVLAPWASIDPEATLVTEQGPRAVADLLAAAPDGGGVRPRPDLTLTASAGAGEDGHVAAVTPG